MQGQCQACASFPPFLPAFMQEVQCKPALGPKKPSHVGVAVCILSRTGCGPWMMEMDKHQVRLQRECATDVIFMCLFMKQTAWSEEPSFALHTPFQKMQLGKFDFVCQKHAVCVHNSVMRRSVIVVYVHLSGSQSNLGGALLSQTPREFQCHDSVSEDFALRGPNDCLQCSGCMAQTQPYVVIIDKGHLSSDSSIQLLENYFDITTQCSRESR